MSKPGRVSAIAGTSGICEKRLPNEAPSITSLPALACGTTPGMVPKASTVSPPEHRGDRRHRALVRHMHQVDAGHLLQPLDREVRDRAVAGGAVGQLAGAGLHHLDELGHRARVQVRARHQHHRRAGDDRDRLEVVQHVVGQLGVQRGADRVARHVGRRPACSRRPRSSPPPRGPSVPPAPGRFSTTNCWPVDSLIALHHRARQHVAHARRRPRHHDPHRLCGIRLGRRPQ